MIEEVKYNAQELIRLTNRREQVLEQLIELAKPLPEYEILLSIPGIPETMATSVIGELGDIRRFKSADQINAFMRNEKDNRKQLQLSHILLPLYIALLGQCIIL